MRQVAIDLAGDVALQDADDLVGGLAFLDPALEVELCLGIVGDAHHDDAPQRVVGLAVPTVVRLDPAAALARALGDGRHTAEVGPRPFRAETFRGYTAGRQNQGGRGVGTDAEEVQQIGNRGDEEGFDPLVEPASSSSSELIRCARTTVTPWWPRSPDRGERPGRQSFAFGDQSGHREAFHATTKLLRCAVADVAHLDQGLASGLAGRALGHDENPDGLDGTVSRLGFALGSTTQGGPGSLDGVEGIGLAGSTALLTVRSVDLEDLDANSLQVARSGPSHRTRCPPRRPW